MHLYSGGTMSACSSGDGAKRTLRGHTKMVAREMTTFEYFTAAIILAQLAGVCDMLVNGRTLPMPVAGGAQTVRKVDSKIGFYVILITWIAIFVGIDLIVFWPSASLLF